MSKTNTNNLIKELVEQNKQLIEKNNNLIEQNNQLHNVISKLSVDIKLIKLRLKIDDEKELDNSKTHFVKYGEFKLDEDFSKKMLEKASIDGDFKMFKQYYITESKQLPFKKINQTKIKYWDGTKWVYDVGFTNLKKIIVSNIRKAYTKVNVLRFYENDLGQLEKNQEHIGQLGDDNLDSRYIKSLIKRIKTEIEIIQLNS